MWCLLVPVPHPSFYPFSFSLGLRLGPVLSFFSAPSVLSDGTPTLQLCGSRVCSSLADYPSVKLTSEVEDDNADVK